MGSQAFPANSSSEEWCRLLQDTLGKKEGAAVAASLGCGEVVINVTSIEDQASGQIGSKITNLDTQKSGALCEGITCSAHDISISMVVPVVIAEEPDSVLHIVAAAGNKKRHLKAARMIYKRSSHLLTTAAAGNSKGHTPLHLAARAGNTKMVACFIELANGENGVDYEKARDLVRMRNKRGETALHEAIRFGNANMVQDLMSADKELAQIEAEDGTSPLYLACSMGDIGTVRLILHEGKEPSYSGPHGQNALHAAALHNRKVLTELLLQRKDLAKQRDSDGSTPLHFAASAPDPFLKLTFSFFSIHLSISYLPPVLPGIYLTWMVQLFGSKRPITQLLAADPTCAFQPDSNGSFPVHIAASADCMVPLLALLSRYPTCARLCDAEGKSFLHVAVEKKRVTVVQIVCLLFGKQPFFKSVVNIQDRKGDTALHLAVRHGELRIVRYLIGNKHVHINLENREGKTPMDLAAGAVKSGFYFGVSAPQRILNILSFIDAQTGNRRRDLAPEYSPRLEEPIESDKIKDFAQIVGIGSVLVATATFAAALTVPGGVWSPGDSPAGKKLDASPRLAGTPLFAGKYAFDGFVISNTLAFMCSTLATFSLVYCGVAAVDIKLRLELVTFSLALLLFSARSFCAAFAFALYLLLDKVAHETGIASIVMTSLALLDGLWFLGASLNDFIVIIGRKKHTLLTSLRHGYGFLLCNILYPFWPYLLMGCYMLYDFWKGGKSQP